MNNLSDAKKHFQRANLFASAPIRHMPWIYCDAMGFRPEIMDEVIAGRFCVSDPEYVFFKSASAVERILYEGIGDLGPDDEDFARALQFKELIHTVCEDIGENLVQFDISVEQLKTSNQRICNAVLERDVDDLRQGRGYLIHELEMSQALREYCEGKGTLRTAQETALRIQPFYAGTDPRGSITIGFLRHSLINKNFGQGISFDPGKHPRLEF